MQECFNYYSKIKVGKKVGNNFQYIYHMNSIYILNNHNYSSFYNHTVYNFSKKVNFSYFNKYRLYHLLVSGFSKNL